MHAATLCAARAALFASALALHLSPVLGADPKYVTVNLTGSPYKVSYLDDPTKWKVDDISFAAKVEVGGFFGTLTKKVTFLTDDPFELKFSEVVVPGMYSGTGGGFKVHLDLKLTNGQKNTKWTSFTEQLFDFDFEGVTTKDLDGRPRGNGTHPLFAHFHPDDLKMVNYKTAGFKKTNPGDINSLAKFDAIDGPVLFNNSWTASGLFIHAMEIKDLPRTFKLIEKPIAVAVPEPATWALLGAGVMLVLMLQRRHGHRDDEHRHH